VKEEYEEALRGSEAWRALSVPGGTLFQWDEGSTYVREPPFFSGVETSSLGDPLRSPTDVIGARILAVLGDSVTTDHISPAGSIGVDTPAGRYLLERDVAPADFNTYGARRGNHEVMVRGTFANVRLRNLMGLKAETGADRFIVICRHRGLQVGLMIQSVATMYRARHEDVDWGVAAHFGDSAEFLMGLLKNGDKLVSVLSIDSLVEGVLRREGGPDA
jgi:aconitase A